MSDAGQKLRLGTRGSLLAMSQSKLIAAELMRRNSKLVIDIVIIKTTGDRITDRPLHDIGGKGLFTKELEQALLRNEIDFAVHSFKDVPITMPLVDQSDLIIACVPAREDVRDVLIARSARSIGDLAGEARVGTGSLRRRCQLLERRPDLLIEPMRGNIDTRLRKLHAGEFDVIVLAMAGLVRAGLFDASTMTPLDPAQMLPAPGQGALALECRRHDDQTRGLIQSIHHPATATAVGIERDVVKILEGDCTSPIAALALFHGDEIELRVAVGQDGGAPPLKRANIRASTSEIAVIASKACDVLSL